MRRKLAAGNWKMNMTPTQTKEFLKEIAPLVKGAESEVLFFVPAIDIPAAVEAAAGTGIGIGAENFYFEDKGAFTGEISLEMIKDAGVSYVLIGHSERRTIFSENDEWINKKLLKAIECKMKPMLCCGESLEIREKGETLSWIEAQIRSAFNGVSADQAAATVIAYEPIWAIGTGKVATTDQAQEVCGMIRKLIAEIYDADTADKIRILYGGSVNPENAAELFAQPDIDGGLVGGASLKTSFEKIVKA